ncbi:hypothetical protein GQ53DRAFT_816255 [Thozetella sp. PMI_491]|nr:hypothetical protein GQ53DRAFT_816255 [Thozetella sp. PMI_491]
MAENTRAMLTRQMRDFLNNLPRSLSGLKSVLENELGLSPPLQQVVVEADLQDFLAAVSGARGESLLQKKPLDFLNFLFHLEGAQAIWMISKSASLDEIVAQGAFQTICLVNNALKKLFNLAEFISASHDDSKEDKQKRLEAIQQVKAAFQDADNEANSVLHQIDQVHVEVVNLEETQIRPTQQIVGSLNERFAKLIAGLENQLHTAEQTLHTMQEAVKTQAEAVKTIESKIKDKTEAAEISDGFFTVVTLGIGNLVAGGPLDPFHLHEDLDNTRRAEASARNALMEAQFAVKDLQDEFDLIKQESVLCHLWARGAMHFVDSFLTSIKSRSTMLQTQIVPLKNMTSQMVRDIDAMQVQEGAIEYALDKREFSTAILSVCSSALVDPSTFDTAELSVKELMDNYGEKVPDDVQQLAKKVSGKISDLRAAKMPTLEQRMRDLLRGQTSGQGQQYSASGVGRAVEGRKGPKLFV